MLAHGCFSAAAWCTCRFSCWGCAYTACPTPRSNNSRSGPTCGFPVLTRFCASSEGCHGDHATRSATLDLRSGHAHHDLVAVAAKTRAGARLVVPGDPDRSYLLDKLRGALATGEGKSMPLDPETGAPLDISPLPAGFIDRVLEIWIVQGAPND